MNEMRIGLRTGPSRLERLRESDRNHRHMIEQLIELERIWMANKQTLDDRREACTSVAAIIFKFAKASGLTPFAVEMANDLHIALGELFSGRHSELLKPAKVPSNTLAPVDLFQQGMAHACVEVLREAGIGATDARREVARYLLRSRYGKFSTHKLRTLGTGLTGPGSTEHPAFEFYVMAKGLLAQHLAGSKVVGQFHADKAREAIKAVITTARERDHRT